MFQFSTTNIINSTLDSNGVTAKFAASADGKVFNVARVGSFKKDSILSIYKRPYVAPVKEVAKVTVPQVTAGLVLRATVDVRLYEQTYSEYTSVYMHFGKPIHVEVLATNNATNDATALKNQFNSLKTEFGYSQVVATTSGADLIITAIDPVQQIFNIKIEKEVASPNSIITPAYENVGTSFTVTTSGKPGFGDDNWMARKVMLPTAENVRYFGISKDERPILGGNYTQYILRYQVAKDGNDGVWLAGGTSITTHVFYVLSDLVATFETELAEITNLVYTLVLTVGDASLANGATTQAVVTNAIGTVVFSVVSGTSATISASGLVTADAVVDGDTVIKATDSTGNFAVLTITVA